MTFLTHRLILRETRASECDVHRQVARWIVCIALALAGPARADPLPPGKARIHVDAGGASLEVHTYKPQRYEGRGLVLVLHGVGRNASGYRDYAVPLADSHGLLVAAPDFDRRRFPTWRYQWGGLVRRGDANADTLEVEPEERWTGRVLLDIVNALRTLEGAPSLPYAFVGHSGGGQSLSRVAGFMNTGAQRIVIANPGTYLWPTHAARFPDGFGGLPPPWSDESALRAYLAQPLTLLLGTADVNQDEDLSRRAGALAQGANRHERGHNAFREAQRLAKARGWTFNWKLVEVPGVGHSGRRMLGSEQAIAALAQ